MRVAFVDNLLFEDFEGIHRYVLQPHLGLISLIAVLEAGGHEGLLVDPKLEVSRGRLSLDEDLYPLLARRILDLRPDAVGFTSLGCNFICTVKVAAYLRRWEPDLPILLGGPHATVLATEILNRFPQFDVIVRGEAERKILPLLECLPKREFLRAPGVSFRLAGTIWNTPGDEIIEDLDTLPVPAYHCHPIRELGLSSLRIDAGRGCPFQCTFCSTASFFGRKYRLKSAARLVAEMDFLHREYGVSDFSLTHDLFTVNRHKVAEFCHAVEGRGYTWKCSARMDCVSEELLDIMSAAGCRSIYYGIEAGSERMQKISKKHLDLQLFTPILDHTARAGMSATVSFITGYPEEELEDQRATLDLIGVSIGRDAPLLNVQLHLLTPEPGTELLAEYRDRIAYDGHISDFNFPVLEADDSAVMEGNPSVFINHHYFPATLSRARHIFVSTLYQVLYSLGFPLLRHLVAVYGGTFSALVNRMDEWRMDEWRENNGASAVADASWLQRHFEATEGPDHYLTGLVAYMLKAAELRRLASFETSFETGKFPWPGSEWDPDARYRLSSRVAVIRSVPDCPRMLEQLMAGPADPRAFSRRRKRLNFMLHLRPPQNDEVHNSVVTPACAALLEFSRASRTLGEYRARFPEETGYPAPPPSFLQSLLEQGILEVKQGILEVAGAA
ncbi:MAG TPA: radical SAM protein [Bryobacteraceae bacterium]